MTPAPCPCHVDIKTHINNKLTRMFVRVGLPLPTLLRIDSVRLA